MNDATGSFNIRHDITLDAQFELMCGFTEKDIEDALMYICPDGKDELSRSADIKSHLSIMRNDFNGYRFNSNQKSGIYCTNLCLDYLQRLLDHKPYKFVDPNNS